METVFIDLSQAILNIKFSNEVSKWLEQKKMSPYDFFHFWTHILFIVHENDQFWYTTTNI